MALAIGYIALMLLVVRPLLARVADRAVPAISSIALYSLAASFVLLDMNFLLTKSYAHKWHVRYDVASYVLVSLALGCSSPTKDNGPNATDSGTDAPLVDGGTPDSAPASDGGQDAPAVSDASGSVPAIPGVPNSGGDVLSNPVFVSVTFDGYPERASVDSFVSQIGSSLYWHSTTSEYGVGPASAKPPIHLSDAPPAALDDADIQTWLKGRLDGTHAEWPEPETRRTLYVLYYPEGTSITYMQAKSCDKFYGYHSETALASGVKVAYAVIPHCAHMRPGMGPKLAPLEVLTVASSHEMVEAATDPYPNTAPAYLNPPQASYFGIPVLEGELGDMCELDPAGVNDDIFIKPSDLPFTVQRTWSNAAATARHEPCVPAPSGVYFNAAPVPVDDLDTKTVFGSTFRGWKVPVEGSVTIDVDLFSDGPTNGPWSVNVSDCTNTDPGAPKYLDLALDRTSGSNGEQLHLNAKVLKSALFECFQLSSTLGSKTTHWYGMIQTGAPSP